jgi:hypothetical protein
MKRIATFLLAAATSAFAQTYAPQTTAPAPVPGYTLAPPPPGYAPMKMGTFRSACAMR